MSRVNFVLQQHCGSSTLCSNRGQDKRNSLVPCLHGSHRRGCTMQHHEGHCQALSSIHQQVTQHHTREAGIKVGQCKGCSTAEHHVDLLWQKDTRTMPAAQTFTTGHVLVHTQATYNCARRVLNHDSIPASRSTTPWACKRASTCAVSPVPPSSSTIACKCRWLSREQSTQTTNKQDFST